MSEIKDEFLHSNAPTMRIENKGDGRTRLRVQFDITYKGHPGKRFEGDSMTEPDMTLTLGQLLERHSRGKDIPMQDPVYFEMEVPTFSDITDVERYREQLQRRLDETNEFIKADKAAAAAARAAKEEEAAKLKRQTTDEQKADDKGKQSIDA